MKVGIIGAGVSGLYCMKTMLERGIEVECLEARDDIGGIWNYSDNPQVKTVYKSCRQNHYREIMAYPGFPISKEMPIYLSHGQYLQYLRTFTQQHNLKQHIHFNQTIAHIRRHQGGWQVSNADGQCRQYSHLIMCNGNYQKPNMISFPGEFAGSLIHSSSYKTNQDYKDRKVLIIGMGNSAIQIASDLVGCAEKVYTACNATSHIVPRFVFGKPAMSYYSNFISMLPRFMQSWYFETLLYLCRGPVKHFSRYPKPNQSFLQGRLPISSEFMEQVELGEIDVVPMVKQLDGKQVILKDNQHIAVDDIILCTGFSANTDLFSEPIDMTQNYKFVVSTQFKDLFFIGHVQPVGPVPPVVALQSNYIADILTRRISLPPLQDQLQHIHDLQQELSRRYSNQARYNDRIGFREYLRMLQ